MSSPDNPRPGRQVEIPARTMSVRSAAPAGGPAGAAGPPDGSETLTDLVVERLLLADGVAASKFLAGSSVDDPAREELVLDDVRNGADGLGLNPDTAAAFFRDQFDASKLVQEGLLARWSADPGGAPTTRPDLDLIRGRIDLLTARLLRALRTAECSVRASAVRTERLEEIGDSGRLDALHRRALEVATRSIGHQVAAPPESPATVDAPRSARAPSDGVRTVSARRGPG